MSSRGFLVFAEGSEYVTQAYLLALSLRKFNNAPISIVTNDIVEDTSVFDRVITHSYEDTGRFKTNIRKHVYNITPYDETIVLDSDTLVLHDLEYFWDLMTKDVYYPTRVFTYRNETVTSDFYRKTFTANNLPNCYNAFFYFKKTESSKKFFDLLNTVNDNWQEFYSKFCKEYTPEIPSMDVTTSIALKIANYKERNLSAPFLIHMKPAIQDWQIVPDKWTDKLGVYVDKHANVKLGNYKQSGVLHYTENNFVTDAIIERFKNA